MKILTMISLFLTILKAYGSTCNNLVGTWQNDLNSTMTIESVTGNIFTGYFTGHFYTGVESSPGAQSMASKVSGLMIPAGFGKLVGFTVLFNGGDNLATWVGQCMECAGKEYIYTTFILKFHQPAQKIWMSTTINYNTYWKIGSGIKGSGTQESTNTPKNDKVDGEELKGTWTSPSGDSFKINELIGSDEWKGKYHSQESIIGGNAAGSFDGNNTFTAIGFIGTSINKIKGWAGYINEPHTLPTQMETSWIEHTYSRTCRNPRKFVNFGVDTYSKS